MMFGIKNFTYIPMFLNNWNNLNNNNLNKCFTKCGKNIPNNAFSTNPNTPWSTRIALE